MSKKLALFLCLFLILLLGWSLFGPWGGLAVTVNGHVVRGPLGVAVGLGGVILTVVILFCVAILLAFVFAGVGACNFGCVSFCRCDSNSCFAAIAAAFDDPIVYSLAILRDVAKRERKELIS